MNFEKYASEAVALYKAAGALAGAVGGTLGTYTGQKLFGTSPERRIAMLNKYKE